MSAEREASTAYIGLGGNIGDPAKAMREALELLERDESTQVEAVSSLYRTPPWGKLDQSDFLNAVARIRTRLTPEELLQECLDVERRLKRVRLERWGPRLIDIDVLWYDARQIDIAGLNIPHPRMLERAFVLVPLAEIAPELPLSGQTALQRSRAIDAAGIEAVQDGHWWR